MEEHTMRRERNKKGKDEMEVLDDKTAKPKFKSKTKSKRKSKSDSSQGDWNDFNNPMSSPSSGGRYKEAISLSTKIPTGLIINPAQEATTEWCPYMAAHGDFFGADPDPTVIKSTYDKLIKTVVYYDYYDAIQDKSNGADYIDTTQFSLTNFIAWINAITNALQLYYNIEHILAFNSTPENENTDLIKLQNTYLTSVIRRKHKDLRDLLTRFAIPEKLEFIINYLYQNFSKSVDPQAPIIRINFNGVFHPFAKNAVADDLNCVLSAELYETVMGQLNKPEVRKVNSMITQTNKFGKDTSRNLSAVSRSAVYDRNFSTFWHNMPVSTHTKIYPEVT